MIFTCLFIFVNLYNYLKLSKKQSTDFQKQKKDKSTMDQKLLGRSKMLIEPTMFGCITYICGLIYSRYYTYINKLLGTR